MAFRTRNNQIDSPENGASGEKTTPSAPAVYQDRTPNQISSTTPTPQSALSDSAIMAQGLKDGTMSGFMGTGIELKGEVQFKDLMRIDGHFNGKINSEGGRLIVSNNGTIDADVRVAVAQIHGTVNGNIVASKKIEMGRTSKVIGNIETPELTIEQGAVFDGDCRMTK
jgi:cytoskeletal protein CcmA (bactofilin family)